MPHLRIQTNVKLQAENRKQLFSLASSLVAKELSKPESYVMVSIHDGADMQFGGNSEPLAYAHLESLGFAKSPADITPILTQLLQEQLQVDPSRMFIRFDDIDRNNYGWNGSTF